MQRLKLSGETAFYGGTCEPPNINGFIIFM
jgi:hypothetical protein